MKERGYKEVRYWVPDTSREFARRIGGVDVQAAVGRTVRVLQVDRGPKLTAAADQADKRLVRRGLGRVESGSPVLCAQSPMDSPPTGWPRS